MILGNAFLKLKEIAERLLKDKRVIIGLIIFFIAMIFYGRYFRRIFFITMLTMLGAFSTIYLRYFKEAYVLGVELSMFATVLSARAYGPAAGALVGFLSIFLSLIIGGRFKYSSFISVVTLPLIGFIAPLLNSWPVAYQGIALTALYDAIILPLYILLGSRVTSSAVFLVTHIGFNYWVFTDIAPLLIKIM